MDTSPVQEKNLVFVGQFLVRAFLYGPYLTKIFVKNMLVIRPVQFKGEKCTGLIFQQKFFKKKVVLLYGHNGKKNSFNTEDNEARTMLYHSCTGPITI